MRTAMRSWIAVAMVAGAILGPPASSRAQAPADCEPSWLPTFGHLPGAGFEVRALLEFDDGSGGGPALYVGGGFSTVGGIEASRVARWDGSSWSALGDGLAGIVNCLAVFDDGSGPALYAGGQANIVDNQLPYYIARWDGTTWQPVEDAVNGTVHSMATYDDGLGGGPQLIVGGNFSHVDGTPSPNIARWDGTTWSPLGSGIDGDVYALAVHDPPGAGGPELFAGGLFAHAGGGSAANIARWNGTTWASVSGGTSSVVQALTVFDDGLGGGPFLYAGGLFNQAGGLSMKNVALWDGSDWFTLGSGVVGRVYCLAGFDDGGGPALFAGGNIVSAGFAPAGGIARWRNDEWSSIEGGMNNESVLALAAFDGGGAPSLYAGGTFWAAGISAPEGAAGVKNLARWDGADWAAVEDDGLNASVEALALFDDGSGSALYAAGEFVTTGEVAANRIARWNGDVWEPLGSGIEEPVSARVNALCVYDDELGGGPALYAAGFFHVAGGVPANSVAKWDGASWEALGDGITGGSVKAMTVFDDGSGPVLVVAGPFSSAGGQPVENVAIWDGVQWSGLDDGLGEQLFALETFDDGSGSGLQLYAAGFFTTASGSPAKSIAKWTGTSWTAVGGGANGTIEDLAVLDVPGAGGPALYAAGSFSSMDGAPTAKGIGRWNGVSWSALGAGLNNARAVSMFDDRSGGGPALHAATSKGLKRWNGATWSTLGNATNGVDVHDLSVFDAGFGQGPTLIAGGTFVLLGDSGDSYLASWGGCSAEPSVWTDLGFALPGVAGAPQLAGTGTLQTRSPGALTLSDAAPVTMTMLFISFSSTTAPFKCGTLVPVPVASRLIFPTNGSGGIHLAWSSWPAGLSGVSLYLQFALPDGAAVCGVALSNALRADVP